MKTLRTPCLAPRHMGQVPTACAHPSHTHRCLYSQRESKRGGHREVDGEHGNTRLEIERARVLACSRTCRTNPRVSPWHTCSRNPAPTRQSRARARGRAGARAHAKERHSQTRAWANTPARDDGMGRMCVEADHACVVCDTSRRGQRSARHTHMQHEAWEHAQPSHTQPMRK